MIKLLLSGTQLLLFIIIAWSLLAFVSYNVLTAEAAEKEDIRKMKFVNDDLDDYGLKEIAIEQECKDNGGQWKDNNWCKFDEIGGNDEVEFEHQLNDRGLDYYYADKEYLGEEWSKYQNEKYKKSQKGEQEYQKYVAKQEEKAAKEDAICDNEDADTTDIKLCMSGARQQQLEHNYDKESCEDVNGDWNKKKGSGCTFYEDEQQDIVDAAEEQRKIIDEEEQKALAAIDEYNALQAQAQQEPVIEDYGNTVSEEEVPTEFYIDTGIGNVISKVDKDEFEEFQNEVKEITPEEADSQETYEQDKEEIAEYNEEDDNQVNTNTEDSSDNTDSSDSQDSSDSEDNSSDEGGDSSDSGDDSSSSDDGGDSGESSESEE